MEHSFDVELATKHGIGCAILYKNIKARCKKNEKNKEHFYDGLYWTFHSIAGFNKLFPYLGAKKTRNCLKKLIDAGLIVRGDYNHEFSLKNNRTLWYACVDT